MKQSLNLKQSGSLFNYLMSNNQSVPKVGEGATICLYSDRHAYEVLKVSDDMKEVVIQRYNAKRIDNNGMSDSQEYEYKELQGSPITIKYQNGKWKEQCREIVFVDSFYKEFENEQSMAPQELKHRVWEQMIKPLFDENDKLMIVEGKTRVKISGSPINILFGSKEEYYDFSF